MEHAVNMAVAMTRFPRDFADQTRIPLPQSVTVALPSGDCANLALSQLGHNGTKCTLTNSTCQEESLIFSEAVRALRKRNGWGQEDIAIRVGVTVHAVAAWEKGRRVPSRNNCWKLSQFADGQLAPLFRQWAGEPRNLEELEEPALPANIRRAWETARRGATILAEQAAGGNEYALAELKRFADEMMEKVARAGQFGGGREISQPEPSKPAAKSPRISRAARLKEKS